jgi:putative DNA primase/helicase
LYDTLLAAQQQCGKHLVLIVCRRHPPQRRYLNHRFKPCWLSQGGIMDEGIKQGTDFPGRHVAALSAQRKRLQMTSPVTKAPGERTEYVDLVCASDITFAPIIWLWPGWLAAGKMHILVGAPETGETTLAMSLAATVTTGGRWPDGTTAPAGNVVIWSGEDDPDDTLISRLILSGADLTRVQFITSVRDGNKRRSFDPDRDLEPLRRKLGEMGKTHLLIVAPIVSAVTGYSRKNAKIRRGLQSLVELAAAMRCAVLGITRFSKNTSVRDPVERLSLAVGTSARIVMVAATHREECGSGGTVRFLCRAKSSLGPDGGGFEYDLRQAELKTDQGVIASSVQWGRGREGSVREWLAEGGKRRLRRT